LALLALAIVRSGGPPRTATPRHAPAHHAPARTATERTVLPNDQRARQQSAPGATSPGRTPTAHASRDAATGPRRTATVRTALHPQGYVEMDRCLYRAEWSEPDVPPPAPGAPVAIVEGAGQPRVLLAF